MPQSKLHRDFDISFLSAFKTPAKVRYFYDITEQSDITELYDICAFARTENIPIMIVGGGTNCLFAFDMFEGIIVRNRYTGWEHPLHVGEHMRVRVHSGESVNLFATKIYEHNEVSTLIPWIGLPGTFGGATIGNAGCFGLEMSDIFVEIEAFDLETGNIKTFKYKDMQFSYRESVLKNNPRYFVVSTLVDLIPRGGEYESHTPESLRAARKEKQPAGFSCGSFFKNPVGSSAGKLIDDAGLKGTRVGGVKVSEQHGNFFINDQKAKWQDIIALRDIVKLTVQEKFGIELEEEVRIISNDM